MIIRDTKIKKYLKPFSPDAETDIYKEETTIMILS